MRYRVRAWGSDKHPPLDLVTDEVPPYLFMKYSMVDVTVLESVSKEAILAGLES
jgi:hypothetical protein